MLNPTALLEPGVTMFIFLILSAVTAPCPARETVVYEVRARELVDVEWLPDGRLIMLVSEPRAERPGLYRFRPVRSGEVRFEHHCPLEGAAHLSFDRRHILIRRETAAGSRLMVSRLPACTPRLELARDLPLLDADADADWIALALQAPDGQTSIELYDRQGRKRARATTDRQIELGLAPSGDRLVNFDRTSRGPWAWRLPDLAPMNDPGAGVPVPLPGSRAGKLESPAGQASVLLPDGRIFQLEAHERVRAASRDGRYLLTHRNDGVSDRLDWIDTLLALRETLARPASGAIDHAAVHAEGQLVAWTERSGDQVRLRVRDRRVF